MKAKYMWWDLKDILGFAEMIAREGSNNLRMKVHLDGRKQPLELVSVGGEETKATGGGSFNFSHTCPPDCP